MTEYATIEDFYDDRPERRLSPESDYGVHWRRGGRNWPRWRVSYVQATGEIYAVCQQPGTPGPVLVLGTVPPDPDDRHETGNWDTSRAYYRTLDSLLDGWAEPDVSGDDLAWVKRRLS